MLGYCISFAHFCRFCQQSTLPVTDLGVHVAAAVSCSQWTQPLSMPASAGRYSEEYLAASVACCPRLGRKTSCSDVGCSVPVHGYPTATSAREKRPLSGAEVVSDALLGLAITNVLAFHAWCVFPWLHIVSPLSSVLVVMYWNSFRADTRSPSRTRISSVDSRSFSFCSWSRKLLRPSGLAAILWLLLL